MARVKKPATRVSLASVERARAEADALVHTGRAEAERARREAEAAGLRAGEARAAATLLRAAEARERALGAAETEIREVALEAAARIVEAHVALGGEAVATIVLGALDRQRRARSVRVRLAPDDVAALAALSPSPLPAGVALVPDESLVRGDCVVESDLGSIDARVSTKLDALRRALESAS